MSKNVIIDYIIVVIIIKTNGKFNWKYIILLNTILIYIACHGVNGGEIDIDIDIDIDR